MKPETLVTSDGLQKLHDELQHLTEVRRPEVAKRILEARELGDLKENAEYHDAKNEQAFLETKIQQLEERIRTARVVEKVETDAVGVGCVVEVVEVDSGEREQYVITGAPEADPLQNKVSNESPIGRALMGSRPGETVEVELPRGTMQLRVESIAAA